MAPRMLADGRNRILFGGLEVETVFRSGHVGIGLLLYAPLILIAGSIGTVHLLVAILGAVLIVDLLLPVTAALWILTSNANTRLGNTRTGFGRRSFSLVMLPDIDQNIDRLTHRGKTHTIWFAVIAAVTFGIAGAVVGSLTMELAPESENLPLFSGLFFGYLAFHGVVTHLLGDVLTPWGIWLFRPVSDTNYSLDLVKADNTKANLFLFVVGIAAAAGATVYMLMQNGYLAS
jgi:inner membrane protein